MEERLKKMLAVILEIGEDQIDQKTSDATVDGWDSLKQMNIIVSVEEEFDIQFDEEEAILSKSYQSLLDLIKSKRGQ
jgi:acyl carrier protein